MSNSLIVGYTYQDESRGRHRRCSRSSTSVTAAQPYTSFGSEPFTPNNELRYKTFQLQDNFTKFSNKHSLTFGGSLERYESENVFFPGSQSVYVYNSLADFYTDANGYLANPNRTTSPVTLRRFQVRYMQHPRRRTSRFSRSRCSTRGGYAQDEWRPASNVTVTAGLRFDVAVLQGHRRSPTPRPMRCTFRDENGAAGVSTRRGRVARREPPLVAACRHQLGRQRQRAARRCAAAPACSPAGRLYVWISNQIGNTGVLTGFEQLDNTTTRPFNPDPNRYKPTGAPTGAPAASYELALTDPDFKFPQIWRTTSPSITGCRGLHGTGSSSTTRTSTASTTSTPTCRRRRPAFVGRRQSAAMDEQPHPTLEHHPERCRDEESERRLVRGTLAVTLARVQAVGLSFRSSLQLRRCRRTRRCRLDRRSDPGTATRTPADPNNPGLAYSVPLAGRWATASSPWSPTTRSTSASATRAFRSSGKSRNIGNTSYVFADDMNGDSGAVNDLIYIPRDYDGDELRSRLPSARAPSRPAEQAQAFEAYIQQDRYLREHRGEYAKRGAVLLPMVRPRRSQHHPGCLHEHPRQAERLPDPRRHPELR